jgi:hypothetical protein
MSNVFDDVDDNSKENKNKPVQEKTVDPKLLTKSGKVDKRRVANPKRIYKPRKKKANQSTAFIDKKFANIGKNTKSVTGISVDQRAEIYMQSVPKHLKKEIKKSGYIGHMGTYFKKKYNPVEFLAKVKEYIEKEGSLTHTKIRNGEAVDVDQLRPYSVAGFGLFINMGKAALVSKYRRGAGDKVYEKYWDAMDLLEMHIETRLVDLGIMKIGDSKMTWNVLKNVTEGYSDKIEIKKETEHRQKIEINVTGLNVGNGAGLLGQMGEKEKRSMIEKNKHAMKRLDVASTGNKEKLGIVEIPDEDVYNDDGMIINADVVDEDCYDCDRDELDDIDECVRGKRDINAEVEEEKREEEEEDSMRDEILRQEVEGSVEVEDGSEVSISKNIFD